MLNIGAIAVIWGVLWFLWDHKADAPCYLLVIALWALAVGSALS